MSLSDPIGDMIARVKNAQARNHKKVDLPSFILRSKISRSIFRVFLPCGPSIFILFPLKSTFTFSGMVMLIFPILDIKIPYK